MSETSTVTKDFSIKQATFRERLKLLLALSRTPHGLLDMTTPFAAAIVWLGGLPSDSALILIMAAAVVFAGYTTVYAVNDLVDLRTDALKLATLDEQHKIEDSYLDNLLLRHPVAQGMLPVNWALSWTAVWGVLTLVGAWILNPVCAFIFIGAGILEVAYCRLWNKTPYRILVSGAVKTAGPAAAIFAVDPDPSMLFLLLLILFFLLWEWGGQNIPADWTDYNVDKSFGAKTLPVQLGLKNAARISWLCLLGSVAMSLVVFFMSPFSLDLMTFLSLLAGGFYLLILPGWRMLRTLDRSAAIILFNHASYWPLYLLFIAVTKMIFLNL